VPIAERGEARTKCLDDGGIFGWKIELRLEKKQAPYLLSHPRAKNDSLDPKALHQPQEMAPLDG
jgi:hypothetical protein